ncbi:MAG: sel1 repeat family protein [Gammaproteobacteria bacterium]|nr:sel1 repeat family protein [Gammaproteobacteria bacterium]
MKKLNIVFLLMLLGMGSVRADFNDGVVAYLMGDYETAFNTMISMAKTNETDPLPQYYLGIMYLKGQGVEQNYEEAGKWLRKAAENRFPQAQYNLANLYTEGKGVPKDYETAYIWYRVGASHNHKLSMNAVDKTKAKLSETEYTEAENILTDYLEKYGPKKEEPGKDASAVIDEKNTNIQ